jgi:hypothetical protein
MPSTRSPQKLLAFCTAIGLILGGGAAAPAAEIGHYAGGLPNIRDLLVPAEGLYFVVYNYGYTTDRINDAEGDKLRSVTIQPGPGPGLTLGVDADVDVYALVPTWIWSSSWTIFGARYAAYVAPMFANSSIAAGLSSAIGQGRDAETGQFNVGDLFIQPLWLGWNREHWDVALGYGFYAPVGKYEVETVTLPVVGNVKVEAADNIGLGFFTNQFQGAAAWYPWKDRRMAAVLALTYEIHDAKEDFRLTPGQNVTLNWGLSQYLPLDKGQQLLAEVGPSGYSTWQVTQDSGRDAKNPRVLDQVHAAGAQLGLTYVPWMAFLNFHYDYEFYSEDRPQGQVFSLTLGKQF